MNFRDYFHSGFNRDFGRIWHSTLVRQTGLLYGAKVVVLVTGIISALIIPRVLGPQQYGDLSFINAFLIVSLYFFDLGLYDTGAKLLASIDEKERQSRLMGAFLVFFLIINFFYMLFILSAGSWVDRVFQSGVGPNFHVIAIFSGAFLVRELVVQTYKGLNRIRDIFILYVLPAVAYLVLVLYLDSTASLSILRLLIGKLIFIWLVMIASLIRVPKSFENLRGSMAQVLLDVRDYGFKVFSGRALNTAARHSDKLLIGFFTSTASVGYYTLARIMVEPIFFLPYAISTSSFRHFANRKTIPGWILLLCIIWMGITSGALMFFGETVVVLAFSNRYEVVAQIMLMAIFGSALEGMVQPYHAFLAVKGYGDQLRLLSLVLTGFTIIANIVLISIWGVMGAVYSYIGEQGISLGLHIWQYRNAVREIK